MRIRCPNCHHGLEIVPDAPADFITCPSCGSQLDPNSGETVTYRPESRRVVGRFELLDHVGRGHFGNVWRARDTQLKRIVAVKIPRTADLNESDRQLFLREAITAGHLRHPNIVTVHEVGYDDDAIFIVSDFVEGVPLSEQLKIRRPSFAEAARWCAVVADALDYAHGKGVIHRDMKPGNIMLEGEDKLYVLDFGLAKTEGGDFTITTEGEILGTPAYMSPEQARGDAGTADRRSDVYSLGVVLYELLTGERPFKGGTRSLVHQVLHEEPKSLRRLTSEVPRDLETICLRAMSKEPNHRYITAKEFADDLRRYLAGEPIHARPVRWPERSWRWARRNPAITAVSGVAAAAVLLLTGFVGNWLFAEPAPPSGPVPRTVTLEVRQWKGKTWSKDTLPASDAQVIFWRLDPRTGDFLLDHPLTAAGTPPQAALIPGDYLVVANIPGFGFHEVYRHVPEEGEAVYSYRHQTSTRADNGTIVLEAVEVPPTSVADGMVQLDGAMDLAMGTGRPDAPFRGVRVPPFLLDAHETTIGDLKRHESKHPGQPLLDPKTPDTFAVHSMNWDDAAAYAEKSGKRLPDEMEYEAAATNGGKSTFPWGDDATRITAWETGAIGIPAYDQSKSAPALRNLFSNQAEWMSNWGAPYPSARGIADFSRVPLERVVRGAPINIVNGDSFDPGEPRDPRNRQVLDRAKAKSTVGFRCARSRQPRLTASDFCRDLPAK